MKMTMTVVMVMTNSKALPLMQNALSRLLWLHR